MNKKEAHFFSRWGATLIAGGVTLALMLANSLLWRVAWLYTLAMLLGCIFGVWLAQAWAKRRGLGSSWALFNSIAIILVVLVLSFLFMVVPALSSTSVSWADEAYYWLPTSATQIWSL